MKSLSVLTLLSVSLLAAACGDIKSAQEVLGNRAREQSSLRRAEIDPIQGEYEGYLLDARSARKSRFDFNIVLSGAPYEDASIPEEIATPTLMASAKHYSTDARSDLYVTIAFSTSDYDVKSGQLSFFSESKDSSIFITLTPGQAAGPVETLRGSYISSVRGKIGDFVVTRVKR